MGDLARRLAAGAWVFQPNLFGHGHYAGYDAPLASLWVLAVIRIHGRCGTSRHTGGCAGGDGGRRRLSASPLACAAATKLPGWSTPLMIWASLIAIGGHGSPWAWGCSWRASWSTLLTPTWWTDPVAGC